MFIPLAACLEQTLSVEYAEATILSHAHEPCCSLDVNILPYRQEYGWPALSRKWQCCCHSPPIQVPPALVSAKFCLANVGITILCLSDLVVLR